MDPLYLTRAQCIYLAAEATVSPGDIPPPADLVITDKAEGGWIFVERVGEEDDGVWVDALGGENYEGPVGGGVK